MLVDVLSFCVVNMVFCSASADVPLLSSKTTKSAKNYCGWFLEEQIRINAALSLMLWGK